MNKKNTSDIIYGMHAVMECMSAGRQIEKILISNSSKGFGDLVKLAQKQSINLAFVPEAKINGMTTKNHQGVVAFISPVSYGHLHHIITHVYELGENPFVLILDEITDVRNAGAIIRSCECAGVHAIVMPKKGSAMLNADMMKTSSGALSYVPVCKEDSLEKTIKYLKDSGLKVVACTEKATKQLYDIPLDGPLALVVGSEEYGISEIVLKKADELAKLPMYGKVGSLNVSVAAGVAMYEAVRQRNFVKG
ncbi:MAG: 23S rRNA (guanosine(2251)-2'-O)-methyltransferase RlmB [Cytophagales bacterium]|nr:23S rRNA (guanosine(2251)-2'-O)-methyltransferase RlmB [Cytophagales bacterium]